VHNFDTARRRRWPSRPAPSEPAAALKAFLAEPGQRVLFIAESTGRREMLLENLHGFGIQPKPVDGWHAFVAGDAPLGITVAPLEQPLLLPAERRWPGWPLLTETQLYGERVRQERRRKARERDGEAVVRNLTELHEGAPVVHEEHGVGRFLGLQTIEVGGTAGGVPGAGIRQGRQALRAGQLPAPDLPLHRRRRPRTRRCTASAATNGTRSSARPRRRPTTSPPSCWTSTPAAPPARASPSRTRGADYAAFAGAFEFEETPDQQRAIEAILPTWPTPSPWTAWSAATSASARPRSPCAPPSSPSAPASRWPCWCPPRCSPSSTTRTSPTASPTGRSRSRACRASEQPEGDQGRPRRPRQGHRRHRRRHPQAAAAEHQVQNLGLAIIDEEHRFGVRHKEQLKNLRAEVDVLTLTATPIPRTLNMAMSGMRDLSIIATPPVERHPIKTFVSPGTTA
jgi:transcription-repair coupling factor (superfamily II helicase)